jgi:manganese efflux pump family protein
MDFLLVILMGLALSMDIFTVAIIISLTSKFSKDQFKLPFSFAIFHIIMMLLGYFLSLSFYRFIEAYDHWVAFGLLLVVGLRMIKESFSTNNPDMNWTNWKELITISFATSIDALALGITFNLLKQNIWLSSLIVGIIVLCFGFIGLLFGSKLKFIKPKYSLLIGAIVLISIGIKIVLEHMII